MKLFPSFVTYQ